MKKHISIAPPYSLLFISDPNLGEEPEQNGAHLLWTDTVISITCHDEYDGETSITLGDDADVAPERPAVADRYILTPSGEVVVTTVELAVVLRATVPSTRTRVRIWENHPTEPDDIVIGLG
ncbi:hypothetical protein JOD31_000106 [Methylopila capsulata]|uniref:Uncharacterized protein n=1 Tax=Methylopila capsulata TaxID=61654 RepID=A0A9W6MRI1_9HYPH|nr:hypothetical protein [Methylopila capsulata]MBM7849894.1 hypothetical protein [Methylopila capsulata]GLK55184.1 hypothetical protein GCM10008170_12030 [Methylopila capsulata]